jgi:hypothetical protein
MLIVIVLIAAGILTSSTAVAYARPPRKARSGHTLIRLRSSKTEHLTDACVGLLALGAVALAIHVQLGGSF